MHCAKKEKKLSDKEAYIKISAWCAYQERSHFEVRNKLYEFKLTTDTINALIIQLISENFLNEERFARAYVGGKFRIKKWGKNKIHMGLKAKQVTENCIKLAMQEISDEDYLKTLKELAGKELLKLNKTDNEFIVKRKTADYLIRKGYESSLIWDVLSEKTDF